MKINYFGYYLKHIDDGHQVLFDLRSILRCFCAYDDLKYKARFKYNEENVYFLPLKGDLFVFLITRSQEVIKKIDENNLSIADIKNMLSTSEKIGFASYVLVKENYFCFGATILAPKISAFCDFINQILSTKDIYDYEFCVQSFLYHAEPKEVLKMPFLGRTHVEIATENSMTRDIMNILNGGGLSNDDLTDVGSLEVIIKPKSRKNIKDAVDPIVKNISDQNLARFIVKAKNETNEQLSDLYLTGQGSISDSVDSSNEDRINDLFEEKARGNLYLGRKLQEFKDNERFKKADISHILCLGNLGHWSTVLCGIQCADTIC